MSSEPSAQPTEPSEERKSAETPKSAPSPLEAAEAKIAELEAALKDEKSKYLYLYADFDNFKKRAVKERSDAMKFGWESIAREILGVVDNLERAVEHMPKDIDANLRTGIEMTIGQFRSVLEKQGVALIPAEGQTFNPELHEAMGQEPSSLPSGAITKTLVKGYTLHGRLLRPARVVISTGTPPASAS
ncbi:MAG: nucleotide exchange factor GrpE [Bdellovibrionales bacterium]|nr:nucleotide exchange factor GrpE [Bdellovibrionales bacterium]